MKCNAKYILHKKSQKIAMTYSPNTTQEELREWFKQFSNRDTNRYDLFANNGIVRECQGNVKAYISAEDEPYFGGSSASLHIDFRCDTCGHSHYPDLPQTETALNNFINRILDKMD